MKYTIEEMQDHAALCASLDSETDDHFEGKSCAIIDQLLYRIEALEKDAARWRAATRDMEINDIAVYCFDKYGDGSIVTGDKADDAIDKAMQSKKGGV